MDEEERKRSLIWPVIVALGALNVIAVLLILPLLAGEADGGRMPDMVRFLGRFHPVVLHLPIGILLLVAVVEFGRMIGIGRRGGSTTFGVFAGAGTAVVAAVLGFLLYHGGGWEQSELAGRHLWGGLVVASLACAGFAAKVWAEALHGTKGAGWLMMAVFRLLLFACCGVTAIASHDGASLTHGQNYLTQYAPGWLREWDGDDAGAATAAVKPRAEQIIYADLVAPIFERRCNQCHNGDKQKGKLRMDQHEFLLAGGKEGPAIEPGSAAKSRIIERIELPEDDDEHMPPEGKPDIGAHELVVLKWWLDSGASPDALVGDQEVPAEVTAALDQLAPAAVAAADGPGGGAEPETGEQRREVGVRLEKLQAEFGGALAFESAESDGLVFTAVSMRAEFDDAALAKLGPVIGDLVSLDLSGTMVGDAGLAGISGAQRLRMLRLSETAASDAALEVIGKLPALESLNLYGTAVSDEGLKKLSGLKTLRKLYVWQTKVTDQGVEDLKKALPECEVVTGV